MNSSALWGTSAVPVIVAIIQALKSAGLPPNLAPIAAIALGLATGILSIGFATSPTITAAKVAAAIALGLAWGLSASGLYEVGRTAVGVDGNRPAPPTPRKPPIITPPPTD